MELTGTVACIIYESGDGYTVAEIDCGEPVVAVGNIPGLVAGEFVRLYGDYKTHPKYGKQFAAASYEKVLPSDLNDMVLFLSGGFIKGLGEVLSRRIVEAFGDDTFNVIEENHLLLSGIKGISKKLALSIHEAFAGYSKQKYLYTDLMGLGLTAYQANIIAAEFGDGAPAALRENPYILIERVRGIDFATADKIAMAAGVAKDSPFRVKNGLLNVLNKVLNSGDMYVIKNRLVAHTAERLDVGVPLVNRCLLEMCRDRQVFIKKYAKDFVVVFSRVAHDAELRAATRLYLLTLGGSAPCPDGALKHQREKYGLTGEQADAVRAAVENRVCVITGGPGTGKTTILKAVLGVFGSMGLECALAAPTGRAAQRMREATGSTAKTLHRLLEYSHDEDAFSCYFRRNEENPLGHDVIIVDEVSMLDIFLFNNLLKAIRKGSRLILVGDADQLPPVGPGDVMRDLIASGSIPVVRLTYHFRNAGRIADAAYEILNGEMPRPDGEEFTMLRCPDLDGVVETVKREYKKYYDAGGDVQVVAPVKRTRAGTIYINNALREAVNPMRPGSVEVAFGDSIFRTGDRVMQIKNNYAREWDNTETLASGEGVFNGDIGVIASIQGGRLTVRFEDGKVCGYKMDELNELGGAFAYTIHKSQGSEFEVVIMPMMFEVNPFYTRNLLYTGVTRAREKVILIGNERTLSYMVANSAKSRRLTGLSHELRRLMRVRTHEWTN